MWTFGSAVLAGIAHAATPIQSGGNLGLGLGAGTHASGLSAKAFAGSNFAVQGVAGWWGLGRAESGGVGLSVDALFERPPIHTDAVVDVAWNLGVGGNVGVGSGINWLGVSGVGGLEFNFREVPVDFVLEYRPGVLLAPDLRLDLIGFGAHVRVYPF